MSYPKNLLADDEVIVFDVHHNPVVLARPFTVFTLYLAAWIALLATVDFFTQGYMIIICLALFGVLAIYLGWKLLVWRRVEFVLTNHSLIYRCGVLSRQSFVTPLSNIRDVSLHQTVLERALGFGDIVVDTLGERGATPYINMPDPSGLKQKILEQARRSAGRTEDAGELAEEVARIVSKKQPTDEIALIPPERPPLYSEIVDQIERLEGLRERGTLSDEEFVRAKEALLARLEEASE